MEKVSATKAESLLSVIVPIYNAEFYLHKCIDSILAQTFREFELILVNDGSTDSSGKICDQYEKRDKRVRVCHTKNRGAVVARKTGIDRAKGRYIGFVDADDYIEPKMFESMLRGIEKSGADFIHTGYIEDCSNQCNYVYEFEEGVFELPRFEDRERFLADYVLCANKGRIRNSLWSKLFKRELIKKCFFQLPDEQQLGEDLLCLCLCIMESKRILLQRCAYYHYVMKAQSLSHMPSENFIVRNVELCYHIIGLLKNYEGKLPGNLNKHICCFLMREFVEMIALVKDQSIRMQCFYIKDINKFRGMRVVIYGAGKVGQDYYAQICRYRDIEIVAWVDSYSQNCQFEYAEVMDISILSEYEFQAVIIAVQDDETAKEIKVQLVNYGLSQDIIFWERPSDVLDRYYIGE